MRIKNLSIEDSPPKIVYQNQLNQNYPNPFNPVTTIEYSIANDSHVNLSVYNVKGQLIRTLVNEFKKSNNYKVIWDGKNDRDHDVTSGVYFYRIKANEFIQTRKLVILR